MNMLSKKGSLALIGVMVLTIASIFVAVVGAGAVKQPSVKESQAGTTLTASKTATGFFEKIIEYDWTVVKTATPTSLEIKTGETKPVQYTIAATRNQGSVSERYVVRGQIRVTNGGSVPTENLRIEDRAQYNTGGGYQDLPGASQIIIPTSQLQPGQTGTYNYEIVFTLVSGATYRNVVRITITNHSGYLGQPFGPEPKASFDLPSSPTVVYMDETAVLRDQQTVPQGFATVGGPTVPITLNDSNQFQFTRNVTNNSCPAGQEVQLVNTATLTEADTDQVRQSTATVTIFTGAVPPPPPPSSTYQGYTPGYWKNKLAAWEPTGYSTGQAVGSVFDVPADFSKLASATLLQALSFGGGSKLEGVAGTLLRAGVAALLNAAHPAVNYSLSETEVITRVNGALASKDRNAMLSLATELDGYNNLGD